MNYLERSVATKTGYDNGWEVAVSETSQEVVLSSALHSAQVSISKIPSDKKWMWLVSLRPSSLHRELAQALPGAVLADDVVGAETEQELSAVLEHGARIARALPNEPCRRFAKAVLAELAAQPSFPSKTEVERLVRQRIGQDIYRESQLDYWGGACAVLGVAHGSVLRASHAKAWSECDSDEERLNVFNGLLLSAHLDALFDRHEMTFDETGLAIFAPTVKLETRAKLGLTEPLRLRWISPEHQPFLEHHRSRFFAAE
jgi:hypothetical protein